MSDIKLTKDERFAIDNLVVAIKSLPPSICLEVIEDDWDTEQDGLAISKKRKGGSEAVRVEFVQKKSICFGA